MTKISKTTQNSIEELDYEKSFIAADPVIFTISQKKLKILLHKREKDPFKHKLELPGGLVLSQENAEDTIKRKLTELIGKEDIYFIQFKTFSNPNRDPRRRVISIGFIALINSEQINISSEHWHDFNELNDLAFDHKIIIKCATEFLKKNLDEVVAKQFLPQYFPLNNLQEVYELIEGKDYDNRNFRKKMISSGIVVETEKKQENCSHRPSKLYTFSDDNS
ncbi:NUDIX hydrolase [Candidatus Woesearchaeota archaeon]|jgi:8-oxo-dGTP diphosphatase|nr:NUDIX hydrolase [Candidatus Woesearchaeota archaeon]